MRQEHNEGRILFWILIGITVIIVGIVLLFFWGEDDESVRTAEKTDDADITGVFDPSDRSGEDALLVGGGGGSGGGGAGGGSGGFVGSGGGSSGTPEYVQETPSHYAVLGLSPGASREEIHAAFNRLRRQFGPDGETHDPQLFERISRSYIALIRGGSGGGSGGGGSGGSSGGGSGGSSGGGGSGGGSGGSSSDGGRRDGVPGGGVVFRGGGADPFSPNPVRTREFPGIIPPNIQLRDTFTIPDVIPPAVGADGSGGGGSIDGGRNRIDGGGSGGSGADIVTGGERRNDGSFEGGDSGIEIGSILESVAVVAAASMLECTLGGLLGDLLNFNLTSVNTKDGTVINKECALDAAAFAAARSAGLKMVKSYIDWAVEGFHGRPSFIQNPSRFWADFTDNAIGHALEAGGLGFLCDVKGIRIDISNLLQVKYRRISIEPPRCRLSDFRNNIEGVLKNPVTVVGNPVNIEEGDPIRIGGTYTFYSGTVNFSTAVPDDRVEEVIGDWQVTVTHRNSDGDERTETMTIAVSNTNDFVRTFRGRTLPDGSVEITAQKGAYRIEKRAEVGRDLLEPTLRDRFGVSDTETVTINPLEAFGLAPVDVNRQLDKATEYIERNIRYVSETGNELTQVARADSQVQEVKSRIGEQPTRRQLIQSGLHPGTFASYEDDCTDVPAGFTCDPIIHEDANTIVNTRQAFVDAGINSVNTADELGEVINAVLSATVTGLLKRTLQHGIGAAWRDGVGAEFKNTARTVSLGGGKWWATVFDEKNIFSDIITPDTLIRDANALFTYAGNNLNLHPADTVPSGYSRIGDGRLYRMYTGGLNPAGPPENGSVDYGAIRGFRGGHAIVKLLNTIRQEREYPYRDSDGDEQTKQIAAFFFPDDRTSFKGVMNGSSQRGPIATTTFLREIYEATLLAHIHLVGADDEYSDGGGDRASNRYRMDVLTNPDASERRNSGATEFSLVRDAVMDSLRDGTAKIYVDKDAHFRFFGNDCRPEPDASGKVGGIYTETRCTINDFRGILNEKLRHVPKRTEKLVHFLYAFAHRSGILLLPTASAQNILTEFSQGTDYGRNKLLAEQYQRLGEVFVGSNNERVFGTNWGNLSAQQAENEYRESFRKKVRGRYARFLGEFIGRIPERYK